MITLAVEGIDLFPHCGPLHFGADSQPQDRHSFPRAADGPLLVDLKRFTLDRTLPLALLSPGAAPLVPVSLPDRGT
jgi:hypothetical protein